MTRRELEDLEREERLARTDVMVGIIAGFLFLLYIAWRWT
jgi:hypothetical protein